MAADVVHDTFIRVWRGAARFDPARGQGAAWLTGIARNRALDMARLARREITGLELPDAIDSTRDVMDALAGDKHAIDLRRRLGELEESRRKLVVMAFIDGYTHEELAMRLDMPLGSVKSSIRRSLQILRQGLDR